MFYFENHCIATSESFLTLIIFSPETKLLQKVGGGGVFVSLCGNSGVVRGSPVSHKYGKSREVGYPKRNSLCGRVWIFSETTH